jgi:hypothetical protein
MQVASEMREYLEIAAKGSSLTSVIAFFTG